MTEFMDVSHEYNECFNLMNVISVQFLDWNRIKNLVHMLSQNPLNFVFINNIFIKIAEVSVRESFNNSNNPTSCPYEIAKFYVYQLGIPFYYDSVRINSLFYKYILKDEFCVCNLPNCQFKPPVPDPKYMPILQDMVPKF